MTPFKVVLFLLVAVVLDVVFSTFQLSSWLFVWSGFLMVVFGLLMSEGEEQPAKKEEVTEEVEEWLSPTTFFDRVVREVGEQIHRDIKQRECACNNHILMVFGVRVDHPQIIDRYTGEKVINALLKSDAPFGLKNFDGYIKVDYCEYSELEEIGFGCVIDLALRFGFPEETLEVHETGKRDEESVFVEDVVEMSEEEGEIQMEDMEDLPLTHPVCKQTLTTNDIPQGKAILLDVVDTYVSDFAHLKDDLLDETLHEVQQIVLKELGHLAQGKIKVSATTSEPEAHGGVSKILFVEVMDSVGKSVVFSVTLETK